MSIPRFTDARDQQAVQARLAADLAALVRSGAEIPARGDVFTRPAVLRRLALLLGSLVAPDVEKIVAITDDIVLATATSLTTGMPFAIVEEAGMTRLGELHRSERVIALGLSAADAQRADAGARILGAQVVATAGVSLVGEHAGALELVGAQEGTR